MKQVRALAALALVAGCTPHPAQPEKPKPGFAAAACAESFAGLPNKVDCGTMTVEETRGANNGRLVSFPVVIVHATNTRPKADPVIYLHGGPGGGIIHGLADRLRAGKVPLTPDRDWIFFDQRGTGQSTPLLDCGTAPLSDAGVTSDEGVGILKACGEKFTAAGIDLSQYNSAVIVKDIRDLRAALHITTYNLFGVSYGTRVAMAVMQHDPKDLRAAVLDSVWPPEASATGPLPGLVSREVRQVLTLCAADTACNAAYPDLERRFDKRLTAWLKAPVVKDGKTYTADGVAAYLLDAIYGTDSARALPGSIDALVKGDYRGLDQFMVEQSGYVEGQFFTHMCKEEFPFEQPSAVETGLDEADPIAQATARDVRRFFPVCEGFKVGAPDPVENQPLTSDVPALLLTADIDAGCPAELSDAAVKRLSHGAHYTFANRTHGVSRQSPCAQAMVKQFLATADAHVDAACLPGDHPKFEFILTAKR
ncbi:alpha/beta hydrolase [Asticcacaulis solisilvae]|uniref:alpha/beta hydrolase n=1 Tax=Asticcacaulis solisilvae TaxID=1217274 RepID=UPI003FD76C3B